MMWCNNGPVLGSPNQLSTAEQVATNVYHAVDTQIRVYGQMLFTWMHEFPVLTWRRKVDKLRLECVTKIACGRVLYMHARCTNA